MGVLDWSPFPFLPMCSSHLPPQPLAPHFKELNQESAFLLIIIYIYYHIIYYSCGGVRKKRRQRDPEKDWRHTMTHLDLGTSAHDKAIEIFPHELPEVCSSWKLWLIYLNHLRNDFLIRTSEDLFLVIDMKIQRQVFQRSFTDAPVVTFGKRPSKAISLPP